MEALILGVLFAAFWFFSKKYPEKAKERPVIEALNQKNGNEELEQFEALFEKIKKDNVPAGQMYRRLNELIEASMKIDGCLELTMSIMDAQNAIEDVLVERNLLAESLFKKYEPESTEQARLLLELNVEDECESSYPYQKLLSLYEQDEENYRRIYFQAKKCLTRPESHKWFQKAQKRVGDEG